MENRTRIIVAYILLVGVPLLALVGILRAGSRMTPAPALRGKWIVETDFSRWRDLPCEAVLKSAPQPFFTIGQSGKDLTITLNNPEKTVLFGRIRGFDLRAASTVAQINYDSVPAASCPDPRSLRFAAHIDGSGKERSLKGTISVESCTECAPLSFSAIRQPEDEKEAH
jgi:hypothetical protein